MSLILRCRRRARSATALTLIERLRARPSIARVPAEAEPYFRYFPE